MSSLRGDDEEVAVVFLCHCGEESLGCPEKTEIVYSEGPADVSLALKE